MGAHLKDPFSGQSEPKYTELAGSSPSSFNSKGKYVGVAVSDPFSPSGETKYSPTECDCGTRGRFCSTYSNIDASIGGSFTLFIRAQKPEPFIIKKLYCIAMYK